MVICHDIEVTFLFLLYGSARESNRGEALSMCIGTYAHSYTTLVTVGWNIFPLEIVLQFFTKSDQNSRDNRQQPCEKKKKKKKKTKLNYWRRPINIAHRTCLQCVFSCPSDI